MTAVASSSSPRANRRGTTTPAGPTWPWWGIIASRVVAAVVGGYGLATLVALAVAALLPVPRGEAVLAATISSFVAYLFAALWVFAARSAARAWLGLALPAALCATVYWLLS